MTRRADQDFDKGKERVAKEILDYISGELLKAHGASPGSKEAERILAEYNNQDQLLAALNILEEEKL